MRTHYATVVLRLALKAPGSLRRTLLATRSISAGSSLVTLSDALFLKISYLH